MSTASMQRIPIWPSIRRFLQLSGRSQIGLYVALLAAVLETASVITWNYYLALFVDAVMARQSADNMRYLLLTLALAAAEVPLGFIRARSIGRFSERTMAGLRHRVAARATVLPMRYLEERHTGDLLAVVNADLAKLQNLASSSLLGVAAQSLMAVAALVRLFVISWPLALVSTLLMPVMFLIMSRLNQPIARRTAEMQQAVGEAVSIAQDGLAGLMGTKAFNLVQVMDGRYGEANQRALNKGLLLSRLQAATQAGGSAFGVLPFVITFGFGGYLAVSGHLSFWQPDGVHQPLELCGQPTVLPAADDCQYRRIHWGCPADVPDPGPGCRAGHRSVFPAGRTCVSGGPSEACELCL